MTMVIPTNSSIPLKRTFADIELQDPVQIESKTTESIERASTQSDNSLLPNQPQLFVPEDNVKTVTLSVQRNTGSTGGDAGIPTTSAAIPPRAAGKRRKLTPAEQDARRVEKEAKDRQRAEEKIKQDESKRVRELEKEERRKDRETHNKQREEEKRKKEEERTRREEEKTKKEKSQLRLNSFFAQPSAEKDPTVRSLSPESRSPQRSRRNSLTVLDDEHADCRSRSASAKVQKECLPDYDRCFPPFFLQSHTTLASQSQFVRDDGGIKYAQSKIDERLPLPVGVPDQENHPIFDPTELFHLSPHRRLSQPRRRLSSVKEIVARINGTMSSPIDLTASASKKHIQNSLRMLKSISKKYLRFAEDVRPPYIGTYSKISDHKVGLKLSRNPFARKLPCTNYDYDSEAEWEEPGEGEDLDSEGEEEAAEDEEGDDLDGFLDDEEAGDTNRNGNFKRRPVVGDLESFCIRLGWEDQQHQQEFNLSEGRSLADLRNFKLQIISDTLNAPIDPYSVAYWQSNSNRLPENSPNQFCPSSMDPPRIPLKTINRVNGRVEDTAVPRFIPNPANSALAGPSKPPRRLIAADLMITFKAAIQGSELTKAGLVEVLKKQFPKQSKDAIKDTLSLVAERIGAKEADKRWVIRDEHSSSAGT